MPALLLVRHGQALDPMHGDYDGLSLLGESQARSIGAALKDVAIAKVLMGPRERQKKTAVIASARAPELLELLDEHAGHDVVRELMKSPPEADSPLGQRLATVMGQGTGRASLAKGVAAIVKAWALGDLEAPGVESFASFRDRVGRALDAATRGLDGTQVATLFTSGGFIGAAVAHALGLGDEQAVELGLAVDNASLTELRFSSREPGRFQLKRFNVVAHLDASQLTGI